MGETLLKTPTRESCRRQSMINSTSAKGKTTRQRHSKKRNNFEKHTRLSYSVYVGESFVVGLCNTFYFRKHVLSPTRKGLVFTQMQQLRPVSKMALSSGALRMACIPNAGRSSERSEVLSFELLQRCFGASLQKTEMEVSYFPHGGSITDYTCTLFGAKLGISVTRAMKYHGEFTIGDAKQLLIKKLNGVNCSSQNSLEEWTKQILHVWATSSRVAVTIARAYKRVPTQLKSNTVVLVTIATNTDIFSN